ncbi:MAG: hypothetical protein HY245_13835 [Rhizobiales bacterium]|nr:hypothetical protein [Hyphomicrobiales bacterium]MBI3674472.1 hypothetical protein [Hyphomicrobiales bacterium]
MTGRQLVLDLPHRPALGRDDFLVTPANAAAVAMVDRWPDWPASGLLLIGPAGSGKSHLTEVWRQKSGASRIAAADLRTPDVPELLGAGALAIEDADVEGLDQPALFHAINQARSQSAALLFTAKGPVALWPLKLPDLVSRLRVLPSIELGRPDDSLLRGVLVKLFADRQIAVEEPVISYLMRRMPRSLAAAQGLVREIDRRALEERAEVTRAFVAQVLAGLEAPRLFDDDD